MDVPVPKEFKANDAHHRIAINNSHYGETTTTQHH